MKSIELAIVGDIAFNEDVTPFGRKISTGGAAYYSAIGAARFSNNIGIVARVGGDFDQVRSLADRGVDTAGIYTSFDEKTCRFILIQHPNDTRDFKAQRGVSAVVDTGIFPDSYHSARYIHLPTQLPEHSLKWLDFMNNRGGVSVDSFEAFVKDFRELTLEMFRRADMIFTNEVEYEELRHAGTAIFNKPMVLKRGRHGAVYIDGENSITVPAPMVTTIDTTGAGDVLAGAFLAQRAKDRDVRVSLEEAVKTASSTVTRFGVEHL